jgi:hypothetical protein
MAIKKSDLYSSLWASCDELRGGMDASQYKDFVLFMLFIKYVSDKYGDYDGFEPPVVIPLGASFKDMIALKGICQEKLPALTKTFSRAQTTTQSITGSTTTAGLIQLKTLMMPLGIW